MATSLVRRQLFRNQVPGLGLGLGFKGLGNGIVQRESLFSSDFGVWSLEFGVWRLGLMMIVHAGRGASQQAGAVLPSGKYDYVPGGREFILSIFCFDLT